MADIVRRPSFLPPLALVMLCFLAMWIVIVQRVGAERIVTNTMMKNPRVAEMPLEQREDMIERAAGLMTFTLYGGAIVGPALGMLLIAGVLLVMANFVLAGEATYSQLMAVTAYSMAPACIMAALATFVVFFKDPADVDIENLLLSNLGALVDPSSHPVLHRLLYSIDVFSFWQIALLAAGVAAATRFRFKTGLMAVGVPWGLYVLASVGLRALFS